MERPIKTKRPDIYNAILKCYSRFRIKDMNPDELDCMSDAHIYIQHNKARYMNHAIDALDKRNEETVLELAKYKAICENVIINGKLEELEQKRQEQIRLINAEIDSEKENIVDNLYNSLINENRQITDESEDE